MRPRVVICGSYHKDASGLRRLFKELEVTGCRVLSPISINFRDTSAAIVRAEHEDETDIAELERWHLRALSSADFILVHAPGGHIGTSGAYELGYASALHIPAYSLQPLSDEMLATRTTLVSSVFEVLDQLQLTPF